MPNNLHNLDWSQVNVLIELLEEYVDGTFIDSMSTSEEREKVAIAQRTFNQLMDWRFAQVRRG